MQPAITPKTILNVPNLITTSKRKETMLFMVMFVALFSLTPLLVLGGLTVGLGLVLGIVVSLTVAALIVRWPFMGVYVVTGCVVLIEEQPLPTPILTDHLYIFYWPPGLEGLIERPIGFLFLFILFIFVCHNLAKRKQALQGGGLFLPFLLYLLCVAFGALHGLTSGGSLKIIVVELRPIWYLFMSYLLAYNLITSKSQVRAFFWLVILAAGIKGLQGVYIYLIVLHGSLTGINNIMSHDESFFFVALLLLSMLFCWHHCYRPQLYATLIVMPPVVVALIANERRADYVALLIAIGFAWGLILRVKANARKRLLLLMLICVVLGVGYIAAFSHSSAWFAAPAHGIVSVFSPDDTDTRNSNSNLYRTYENIDLTYTVMQSPLFGLGFGKPYLQPIPLSSLFPDILGADIYYGYVPHNTIYWIWMRLGVIGYFALWYLFGTIIVRGCFIVRQLRDPYLQLVAIYIIGATVMEIIVAFADYQFFFYRSVIYFGLLIGMLMKLPALDEKKEII